MVRHTKNVFGKNGVRSGGFLGAKTLSLYLPSTSPGLLRMPVTPECPGSDGVRRNEKRRRGNQRM